jgi:hypothetical protein
MDVVGGWAYSLLHEDTAYLPPTHKNTRKHPIVELGIYGYICGYAP